MNAMLAAVDGAYLANAVRMLRSQDPRTFLIVEGMTDELFFEQLTDAARCSIHVAHGRENALDAFGELRRSSFAGALVLIDADFDVISGRTPLPLGLLLTDTHDLETLLFASPALDKLLRRVAQDAKRRTFQAKHGDVREKLLAAAAPLGCLLWYSVSSRLHLDFDELKIGKFVDEKTLAVDVRQMVKTVLDHSRRPDLDGGAIARQVEETMAAGYDRWHLCCGHHLAEILAMALRKTLGTHSSGEMDAAQIEQKLGLAYEAVHFSSTRLYADIRTWEHISTPFKVLR